MSEITRTVFLDDGGQKLELEKYELEVTAGAGKGQRQSFEGRRVTIGSSPDNDFILDDPAVSRFHAELAVGDQGYLLVDLDSKNGTRANGMRVGSVFLEEGSVFEVGTTSIAFHVTGEPATVRFSSRERFENLLGRSMAMREIFALLERVSPTDYTVLVEGESGTGKELVAEAIHAHSPRAKGPFIVVDCSAIPRDLIESELFGHVKGAFTGASGTRKGAFEAARGGTLFLDELGELPLELQPKLLRALESKEVKPVGSNEPMKSDARIVAATNRNLIHEVREGNFREDLYYRFAVIKVALPPLRERPEDISLLVEHFLQAANEMAGREDIDISYRTMEKLKRHRWPGNIRELKNFIERAVLLAQGDTIETRYLNTDEMRADADEEAMSQAAAPMAQMAIDENLPFKEAKNRLIEEFEKSYWSTLLERTGGNVSKAARIAGVHRKSVEYILKKLDLTRDSIGV
ncbi:MAG: sigma 54-interacting transcriptional regulator [Myxococcota bacterium]